MICIPPRVNKGICFSSRSPAVLARCFVDVGHSDWEEMKSQHRSQFAFLQVLMKMNTLHFFTVTWVGVTDPARRVGVLRRSKDPCPSPFPDQVCKTFCLSLIVFPFYLFVYLFIYMFGDIALAYLDSETGLPLPAKGQR